MRIALLTDIHANREALTACLEHASRREVDRYALLGDFVGYGADPSWVVDQIIKLRAQGAIAVLGNHDTAIFESRGEQMNEDAHQAVEWTRSQLNPGQIDFLRSLPLSHEDAGVLYVHANAWAPGQFAYIAGDMDADRSMHATSARITFCGHVHDQMLYHLGRAQRVAAFQPVAGSPIPLSSSRRWLAIAGSCGQPRDGNPAACYAIFDQRTSILTFYRVPYDYDQAARKIRDVGLPQRLASRLEGGI
ncbi:metallophosphoesterase family protein [Ampullimonas aquatilis]|uniref:metallophosphoesterase family protein n=1 Tax=Ampullimonas aquatilis TaxID=1341549 RepID=UPI003C787348